MLAFPVGGIDVYFAAGNFVMRSILKTALFSIGYEIRRKHDGDIPEIKGLLLLGLLRSENAKDREAKALVRFIIDNIAISQSQIFQDLFVLQELNGKRGGYFVEFGATDGRFLSNTFALEKHYDWKGIVAEPPRSWHNALKINRACTVDLRCIWKSTGETLQFAEAREGVLSTLAGFKETTNYIRQYPVETVSLNDLLEQYNAQQLIDYLSIDTEGSELDILRSFDFSKHSFRVITVEHNYQKPQPARLFELLTSHGYKRKFENISLWDDWYVKDDPLWTSPPRVGPGGREYFRCWLQRLRPLRAEFCRRQAFPEIAVWTCCRLRNEAAPSSRLAVFPGLFEIETHNRLKNLAQPGWWFFLAPTGLPR